MKYKKYCASQFIEQTEEMYCPLCDKIHHLIIQSDESLEYAYCNVKHKRIAERPKYVCVVAEEDERSKY